MALSQRWSATFVAPLIAILAKPMPPIGQPTSRVALQRASETPLRSSQPTSGLTVVYGTWRSGPSPLQVDDVRDFHLLVPADDALLSSLPGGRVAIDGGGVARDSEVPPLPRMIVLFTAPLLKAARLQKPASGSVLYLQDGDRFRAFPPDTPAGTGVVEFATDSKQPYLMLWVDLPLGAREGHSAVLRSKWW